jgi:hypothetical protein
LHAGGTPEEVILETDRQAIQRLMEEVLSRQDAATDARLRGFLEALAGERERGGWRWAA